MINYFGIEKQYEEDLIIIFKSKKYEIDIKSIKFFFDNFSGKKLPFNEKIELSKMKLDKLKETLKKYMIINLIIIFINYLLHFMIKKKQLIF